MSDFNQNLRKLLDDIQKDPSKLEKMPEDEIRKFI
jgi:hypothetical protein